MKKVAFSSKWLDDSNGLVKDCSNEFMEQNETRTQKLAMPSSSAAGLLARMAKGVVSFLQNLLSPLTRKEGVRTDQEVFRLRELSQTTAIGALYGLLFAGLLLAPFQIKSSVRPCSKIYAWNIHLFPVTPENTIPLDLCLEDFGEFIPAYHQIGTDLSREIREIKIDWAECREDATVDAAICLGACGLTSIPVGSKRVRDLIRDIIKNNAVPEAHLPPLKPGNPGRNYLTGCALICTAKWALARRACWTAHNRAYDEAHRRANDKVKDLVDRWHQNQTSQSVECGSDLGCGSEGAWEGTIRPRGH